eukprot:TRINITY_DN1182_c1_g1_i1.p1 TRINITY_DN1182_c1_g1~~TRINITY_DN1182_c1_g1_i1.p1  ORF type:complete len:208 (-),score=105.12 TRINITY_DN1182_c1_g1_i1:22-567(-)
MADKWTLEVDVAADGNWNGKELICKREGPSSTTVTNVEVILEQPGWIWLVEARKDIPLDVWDSQPSDHKKIPVGASKKDGFEDGCKTVVKLMLNGNQVATLNTYFVDKEAAQQDKSTNEKPQEKEKEKEKEKGKEKEKTTEKVKKAEHTKTSKKASVSFENAKEAPKEKSKEKEKEKERER